MVVNHDKVNLLYSGWYVEFKDGSVITQGEMLWAQVPNKKDIVTMGLKWRHKRHELKGKNAYIPPGNILLKELNSGRGSIQTKSELVGRFIGYYDENEKVIIRFNDKTGKFIEERVPY